MTISNMAIEVGAKAGLMRADAKTLAWFEGRSKRAPMPVDPDADAVYARSLAYDASRDRPAGRQAALGRQRLADRGGRGHADPAGLPRHVHERSARGLRDRGGHPRRAARCTPRCASSSRRRASRSTSTPCRGLHPDARRGRRGRRDAGLRPVRGHAQRRAERRRERHLDGQPQLQGPHGQQQRVRLPRQPGDGGRERHRGQSSPTRASTSSRASKQDSARRASEERASADGDPREGVQVRRRHQHRLHHQRQVQVQVHRHGGHGRPRHGGARPATTTRR